MTHALLCEPNVTKAALFTTMSPVLRNAVQYVAVAQHLVIRPWLMHE